MRLVDVSASLRWPAFRLWRALTVLIPGGRIEAFGPRPDQIGAILAVNLDRQPERWRRLGLELRRFGTSDQSSLLSITRRLSAIDARDGRAVAATADVDPNYRIGDQLYVQPDATLASTFRADEPVRMTRQEVAVARSHIEAWKAIVASEIEYTLVLEDDAWLRPGARRLLRLGWRDAIRSFSEVHGPHFLYIGYDDAGGSAERIEATRRVFRPVRGFWHLSGYVLSRHGALALLRAMPVVGPIDLWVNYRLPELDALALQRPAISQRSDARSDNLYSVMPFLARAGVIDSRRQAMPPPIGAVKALAWTAATEYESLPMALSMLGLRVRTFESNDARMDDSEVRSLLRDFDALVNPPLLQSAMLSTGSDDGIILLGEKGRNEPLLPPGPSNAEIEPGSWDELCTALALPIPAESYPKGARGSSRLFRDDRSPIGATHDRSRASNLPADDSPWVAAPPIRWEDRPRPSADAPPSTRTLVEASMIRPSPSFRGLNETFPGNLASFSLEKLHYTDTGLELRLGESRDTHRPFSSGAFASRDGYTYGRFAAEIRPARGPGLVTGFFLHRGGPRQEIDIEFVGTHSNRMLTNIYYNPGDQGASLNYGYRGTPCWVDLNFDASADFHLYEIDWRPEAVTWLVDGRVVHERRSWDPTPIPHLDLKVFGNLWTPRSPELAGRRQRTTSATSTFRNVKISS